MVKRSPVRKTLASLAAELGVSRTTVSNAYNRPDQLSPELRERILTAARAHGYSGPDPMARSLRTRRVGSIGVVLTEDLSYAFEDAASVDILAGMAQGQILGQRSEEHTSELQSRGHLVCRLLLEKKEEPIIRRD